MIEEEKNLEIFAEENVVLCLWNYWIDGPLESFKNELTFSLYNITKFNLLGHHDVIDGGNYIEDKDIDVCIDKAYATKRKYAIISVPGHHMNYKTVWELKQKNIIDMAIDRGKFICQSQSMNLFLESPDIGTMTSMHSYSWKKGLKTGVYYLRSRPSSKAIQFTLNPTECENCSA